MKNLLTLAVLAAVILAPVAAFAAEGDKEEAKPAPIKLETEAQKVSYVIGSQIGTSIKSDGIEIDMDAFVRGLTDARAGRELAMTQEEMQQAMTTFREQMMAKMQAERAEAGAKAGAEGAKFLAENAEKPGVKTTESGLQYVVVEEGDGATPEASDVVRTHYRGTLIDGTEFDSSYARGEPAEFPVNGVIAGWTEALQLMQVGDKWKLFIPSDLAYGERGAGQDIPPNATLIFDIELLEVVEDSSIAIPQE
ncbi:MAG: peptidyl-prolyl cis-trans isomerase [Candidatus Hydrogenedentota bacterium]